jgi:Flp pilus assembly protein TadG
MMMMPRPTHTVRRFAASARGIAAVEFALVSPMLLLLLLGSIDAGRAVAVYMKVRTATYVVDTVTNQYSTIQDTDMQTILQATSKVLYPYSNTPVVVVLSQVKVVTGGAATVGWSDTLNGTARAVGSSVSVPANLAVPTPPYNASTCSAYPCYLILGEVSYTYTPMFGYFLTGAITLSDTLYVTPRNVNCIQRNASC